MADTIRTLIDVKINIFRDISSLDPQKIAEELIELSSLWASIQKELIDRKCWYMELRKKLLVEHGKANIATIYAEASPEYKDVLTAESYSKAVQEMIRTGKYYIRIAQSAQRESVY